MKTYYIYIISHPNSEHIYIGKTSNINKRFKRHILDSSKNKTSLNRFLQKYPNSSITEIDSFTNEEECLYFESWYINLFKTWNLKLLNHTEGGEGITGYNHTDEGKLKISKANKGKILTEETKIKISESNKNKTYSDNSRKKMSEAKKGEIHFRYNQSLTEEHKNKLSKANTRIIMDINAYDLQGNYIGTYSSASEAKNKLKISSNTGDILKVCKGLQKSCKGYIFQFKDSDKISEVIEDNKSNPRLNTIEVFQLSLDGEIINTFKNSYQAEKELGIRSADIRAVCEGRQNTCGGYKWKYNDKSSTNNHKCHICNQEVSIRGMAMHLKFNHSLNTEQYVQQFGEFRPKQQKTQNIPKIKCKICGEELISYSALMNHITRNHPEISKIDYIKQYYYNNDLPKCKCGCGENTTILTTFTNNCFHREYIKGHWDWVKPGYNSHSEETKLKMRESAIKRIENEQGLYKGVSSLELEFREFLEEIYKDSIIYGNTTILNGKELDVFIPELKIAIEFNGTYYHSTKFKDKNYHLNKTKECNKQNIHLIHIWDTDWIFKKDIIKSMITNQLSLTPNTIYARKCVIKEIDHKTSSLFLETNHLQGNVNSKIRLGLFYNNELKAVMTFGSLRKNLGQQSQEDHYELLRFCSSLNTNVIGGADKLYSYFCKTYKPKYIISYANRDWSRGNLYRKLNMNENKPTPPGYSYYKSKIRYNRFNFRKDILVKQGFDPSLTEEQIMDSLGYYKVYNTGNFKFESSFPL